MRGWAKTVRLALACSRASSPAVGFRDAEVRDHCSALGNTERAVAGKVGAADRCCEQMPAHRVVLECAVGEEAQGAAVFAPEQFYGGQ